MGCKLLTVSGHDSYQFVNKIHICAVSIVRRSTMQNCILYVKYAIYKKEASRVEGISFHCHEPARSVDTDLHITMKFVRFIYFLES